MPKQYDTHTQQWEQCDEPKAKRLRTSWDDHYMRGAFYSFISFALKADTLRDQYAKETGDTWAPGLTAIDRMVDEATGRDLAYLQGFSDWCERRHFGTPADLEGAGE